MKHVLAFVGDVLDATGILALVGVVLFVVSMVTGCAPAALPTAKTVANAAADLGDAAESVIKSGSEGEQRKCLDDFETIVDTMACVTLVRREYAPAWEAYRRFRQAWLAARAQILAAEAVEAIGKTPDVAAVATAVNALLEAESALSIVVSNIGGAK